MNQLPFASLLPYAGRVFILDYQAFVVLCELNAARYGTQSSGD